MFFRLPNTFNTFVLNSYANASKDRRHNSLILLHHSTIPPVTHSHNYVTTKFTLNSASILRISLCHSYLHHVHQGARYSPFSHFPTYNRAHSRITLIYLPSMLSDIGAVISSSNTRLHSDTGRQQYSRAQQPGVTPRVSQNTTTQKRRHHQFTNNIPHQSLLNFAHLILNSNFAFMRKRQ